MTTPDNIDGVAYAPDDITTTVGEITVTAPPLQAVGIQQASFRGVPFGVYADSPEFGRRLAVHEYPYRDVPWPEDLGRKSRRFTIDGFLISNSLAYGGGDVFGQISAMIVAAETEGLGTLVHPYLGSFQVACESFKPASGLDADGYLRIAFTFVEGGNARFPSNAVSTGASVTAAAGAGQSAIASDFSDTLTPLLPLGYTSQDAIQTAAANWTGAVIAAGADATSLFNLASELSGNFGRFFNGANVAPGATAPVTLPAGTTFATLVADQATDRAAITTAATSLTTIAANLGVTGSEPTDLANAAVALFTALGNVIANPADALRILQSLAAYSSGATDSVTLAMDNLHQRAAVIALALAAETYQPSSYNDAATVRSAVTQLLDHQITVAGDHFDDASLGALQSLRTAVIQDLTVRGAALAYVATFNLGASAPALSLAQRLYRDPTRADQLTAAVNPPNPLFFPATFEALAA